MGNLIKLVQDIKVKGYRGMKFKLKDKKYIILGVIVALSLIIYGVLNSINSNKMQSYTKDNIIAKGILNSTLTEVINKSTTQVEKGPIPKSDKIAYITIDDGPSKYTDQILDILKENNVEATFFMMNNNMKLFKEQVKRMADEGHSQGFHSITHNVDKLYKTPQATLKEFDTCQNTLKDITGITSKLIRLPYGSKPYMPKESHDILIKNKYKIWDWNLDTLDWKSSTDNIVSNILYYGRNRPNLVILMHEKEQTVKALDSMIKVLKERGYDIEPITENMQEQNYWRGNL